TRSSQPSMIPYTLLNKGMPLYLEKSFTLVMNRILRCIGQSTLDACRVFIIGRDSGLNRVHLDKDSFFLFPTDCGNVALFGLPFFNQDFFVQRVLFIVFHKS